MKVIRTYQKGADVSYRFPSTNKQWSVQLAGNVKSIAFVGSGNDGDTSSQLREMLTTHPNLTCLDNYCFDQASDIDGVMLSPCIKSINEGCFNKCSGVKAVSYRAYEEHAAGTEAPQLNYIGGYAFSQCEGLQSLTLPESINNVSQLDSLAFAGASLTSVTFLGITSSQLLGG